MPLPRLPFVCRRAGLVLVAAVLLSQAACRPVRESAPAVPEAPRVSREAPAGYARYTVISGESEVRALVFRDGPMARFGHNHVIRSQGLRGDVYLGTTGEEPHLRLVLPAESFAVDDAAARAEEGAEFPGVVPDDAIAGTRRNMLGDGVLDAGNFPEIRLTSRRVTGKAPDYQVTVAVEVKGRTHDVVVPVHVEQAPGQLRATGQLTVTHADLGLTPFSVMGGLLSVRNEITLRFRIVARPLP